VYKIPQQVVWRQSGGVVNRNYDKPFIGIALQHKSDTYSRILMEVRLFKAI